MKNAVVRCLTSIALTLMPFEPAGASSMTRAGSTELISVGTSGEHATGTSEQEFFYTFLSADGRHFAFVSDVDGLAEGDATPPALGEDLFVRHLDRGKTEMASVSSSGDQGLGECLSTDEDAPRVPSGRGSNRPGLSANGRYVAFESCSVNLVPGDTNLTSDIFVRDLKLGVTRRVSISSDGTETDRPSTWASISAGGRRVAFLSSAWALGGNGSLMDSSVFVHDIRSGETVRASERNNGDPLLGCSHACGPSIDATGRYVAFTSNRREELKGSFHEDAYIKDLKTGELEIVNKDSNGNVVQVGGHAPPDGMRQSVSAGGRFVLFSSFSSELVPTDTNALLDLFVRDRQLGRTYRVNVSSAGEEIRTTPGTITLGDSEGVMDAAGRYIAFASPGSNFAEDDTESDIEVFVHDLLTGATRMASVGLEGEGARCGYLSAYPAKSPTISGDGRYVGFHSCALNLMPNEPRTGPIDAWQLFLRDQGRHLGGGPLGGAEGPAIEGIGHLTGKEVLTRQDLTSEADRVGADLVSASLAYRPYEHDLFVSIDLERMGVVERGLLYGFSVTTDEVRYEVRAQRTPGPDFVEAGGASFGLFRCDADPLPCSRVSGLTGGYGTTGNRVVLALPLSALEIERGLELREIRAFVAVGSYDHGPLEVLDEIIFDGSGSNGG